MEVKPEVKPEVVKEKRKPGAQPGRVMTDAQREGLKKGFEALKAKRDAIKAEKEAKKAPLTKPDELPTSNQTVTNPVVNKPLDIPAPLVIAKKSRNRIPAVSKPDFEAFKNEIYNKLGAPVAPIVPVVPVVQNVPVPIVQNTPQVLSGSQLLNRIFFNK
jgi:hypothetical protein